jgi:vacuolar-type H+-ATPase subunit F/Vma7
MTKQRILVVGSADTELGLGLLGIAGTEVATVDEAAAAFDAALATPGVGLVLLGQTWSEALRGALEAAALNEVGPLVVEIPDAHAPDETLSLGARVERVLGLRLEAPIEAPA